MGNRVQTGTIASVVLLAVVLVSWNKLSAVESPNSSSQPGAMVRRCVQNLMKQIRSPIPIRFQERTEAPWGSEVRDVILTKEGRVDRLIEIGDRPLTSAQQKKEVARLNVLLQRPPAHPVTREQDEELKRRLRLVAAIPQAFSYQLSAVRDSGIQELAFFPAEHFHPENRETRVYQGMRGVIQIDTHNDQLLRVDGEIFRNVSFGWGILGRLHRGGHFRVEQHEVLPGHWEITGMDFDFTYTVFFFSTSHYLRKTSNSAYRWIDPDTQLSDAIHLLLTEPSDSLPPNNFTGHHTSFIAPVNRRAEGQNASIKKDRPSSGMRRFFSPESRNSVTPLFR